MNAFILKSLDFEAEVLQVDSARREPEYASEKSIEIMTWSLFTQKAQASASKVKNDI